jgi:hypothetical protein
MACPLTPPLEKIPTSRRQLGPRGRGSRQAEGTIETRPPKKPRETEPHDSLFAAFVPSEVVPSAVATHRSITLPAVLPARRLGLVLLFLVSGALAAAAVWLALVY